MSVLKDRSLLMIGCGNMGQPILKGALEAGLSPERVTITVKDEENKASVLDAFPGMRVLTAEDVSAGVLSGPDADMLLYAAKPQDVHAGVLKRYDGVLAENALVVTIAAGVASEIFAQQLSGRPVVRVMPNTPAMVGEGMVCLYAEAGVAAKYKEMADALFSRLGVMLWVDDESLMHVVTAVSGSGPAYVFHLMECLESVSEVAHYQDVPAIDLLASRHGTLKHIAQDIAAGMLVPAFREAWVAAAMSVEPLLTEQQARLLVEQTLKGAIVLAQSSGESPTVLCEKVTSKGGTTAAGLDILMNQGVTRDGLPELMKRTVAAATARSRELGE